MVAIRSTAKVHETSVVPLGNWKVEHGSTDLNVLGEGLAFDGPSIVGAGTGDEAMSLSGTGERVVDLNLVADIIFDYVHSGSGLKVHECWDDVSSNTSLDRGSSCFGMLGSVASIRVDVVVGVDGICAGCGVDIYAVVLA